MSMPIPYVTVHFVPLFFPLHSWSRGPRPSPHPTVQHEISRLPAYITPTSSVSVVNFKCSQASSAFKTLEPFFRHPLISQKSELRVLRLFNPSSPRFWISVFSPSQQKSTLSTTWPCAKSSMSKVLTITGHCYPQIPLVLMHSFSLDPQFFPPASLPREFPILASRSYTTYVIQTPANSSSVFTPLFPWIFLAYHFSPSPSWCPTSTAWNYACWSLSWSTTISPLSSNGRRLSTLFVSSFYYCRTQRILLQQYQNEAVVQYYPIHPPNCWRQGTLEATNPKKWNRQPS